MGKRYAIGVITGKRFDFEGLGNDPDLTTFDTMREAVRDAKESALASGLYGKKIAVGVYDNRKRRITWKQKANPAQGRKAVSLRNFSGTITKQSNGTVRISGRQK